MTKHDSTSRDEAISRLLEGGDLQEAATVALKLYGPQLLGFFTALLRNEEDGCEVFSQFSEELWKSLPGFARRSSFRTWAYVLAWRTVNRFRKEGFRRRARPLATEEISRIVEEVRSTTVRYRKTEAKNALAQLRETLDPFDQTLLFLRIDQGLSWKDVCEVMSEPGQTLAEPALRKRFERLKAELRERAEREGLLRPS
jgi:RNA polymerase sigma-70 factor (ECF subfamily)